MPFNLPNALTWLRILLIPVFLLFYYLPEAWMERQSVNLTAAAIFGLAAMTDWLDGYLARKLNQMSAFGAFLDPVADKLMVAAALILLQLGRSCDRGADYHWPGDHLCFGELAGAGGKRRRLLHWQGQTASQMVAILLLLNTSRCWPDTHLIGTRLIYLAALMTVVKIYYIVHLSCPASPRINDIDLEIIKWRSL